MRLEHPLTHEVNPLIHYNTQATPPTPAGSAGAPFYSVPKSLCSGDTNVAARNPKVQGCRVALKPDDGFDRVADHSPYRRAGPVRSSQAPLTSVADRFR